MTASLAQHTTFTIERDYSATPALTFSAWSSAEAKARWFFGPPGQWTLIKRKMDFRVGGMEHASGSFKDGPVSSFDARYYDIVPNERIIYAYDMHLDDKLISVSIATIQFTSGKKGTRLIFTEQATFVNGYDDAGSRERGTNGLLDQLGAALEQK